MMQQWLSISANAIKYTMTTMVGMPQMRETKNANLHLGNPKKRNANEVH